MKNNPHETIPARECVPFCGLIHAAIVNEFPCVGTEVGNDDEAGTNDAPEPGNDGVGEFPNFNEFSPIAFVVLSDDNAACGDDATKWLFNNDESKPRLVSFSKR